jgi:hypothetical protein
MKPRTNCPPRLLKRRRRFRLRVLRGGVAGQADQASDLVLLLLRLMHPRPAARRPGAQPPAIDLDGGDDGRRRRGPFRLHLPPPVRHGLGIPCGGQFAADEQGQFADVARADRHAGQVQGEGGVREGEATTGFNDHLQHGGAVAVAVQAPQGPGGGKSPGGSRDRGTPARVGSVGRRRGR